MINDFVGSVKHEFSFFILYLFSKPEIIILIIVIKELPDLLSHSYVAIRHFFRVFDIV